MFHVAAPAQGLDQLLDVGLHTPWLLDDPLHRRQAILAPTEPAFMGRVVLQLLHLRELPAACTAWPFEGHRHSISSNLQHSLHDVDEDAQHPTTLLPGQLDALRRLHAQVRVHVLPTTPWRTRKRRPQQDPLALVERLLHTVYDIFRRMACAQIAGWQAKSNRGMPMPQEPLRQE